MTSNERGMTDAELMAALRDIRLVAIDVDGVLTDDTLYFGPDGLELKRFNISDGFFMTLAMRAGLEIAIVSGRHSEATTSRMRDLGIRHVLQGKKDKVAMTEPLLTELGISFTDVAFIGNEILDISLAERVGLPVAVADAAASLKQVTRHITQRPGGQGAVRELLEAWFRAVDKDPRDYIT